MTHSFIKKALTFIGVAALAVPLALGMNGQKVSADDPSSTPTAPARQTVILTKYSFNDSQETKEQDTSKSPDDLGQTAPLVNKATYAVYDITGQYWENVSNFVDPKNDNKVDSAKVNAFAFKISGDPVATGITGADGKDGQATFSLPKKSANGQNAVYLFTETDEPTGYAKSADFVLSMPAATNADGNVYVYPKENISATYHLKFTKVDENSTKTLLSGAQFYITRSVTDKDGNTTVLYAEIPDQKTVTGFKATVTDVKWVAGTGDATLFESDTDGTFGFTANPELINSKGDVITGLNPTSAIYGVQEFKAPDGYTKEDGKIDGKALADVTVKPGDDQTVTDAPQGILPHTGGAGIVMYIVIGVALVVLGTIAYKKRRAN